MASEVNLGSKYSCYFGDANESIRFGIYGDESNFKMCPNGTVFEVVKLIPGKNQAVVKIVGEEYLVSQEFILSEVCSEVGD